MDFATLNYVPPKFANLAAGRLTVAPVYLPYEDMADTLYGSESVIASEHADSLFMHQNQADLTLSSLGGDDYVWGGSVNDTIDAGAGDDHVGGYDGDDVIILGEGADVLHIARSYDYWAGAIAGHGDDVVLDFDIGNDLIVLTVEMGDGDFDPLDHLVATDDGALLQYGANGLFYSPEPAWTT